MVMIEAMALGCPVLAFARGAAPEIVAHRRSGFLVEGVNEMAHCIGRIDELQLKALVLPSLGNGPRGIARIQWQVQRIVQWRLVRRHRKSDSGGARHFSSR